MESIDNQVALDNYVRENEAWKGRVTEEFGQLLNIFKHDWSKSESNEGDLFRLGKFLQAVQRRDRKTVYDMGGKDVRYSKAKQDFEIGRKADLGTPVTGDDTGTVGSYAIPTRLYGDTVVRFMNTQSMVIPRVTRVTMPGRLIRYPTESTSFAFTFVTNEVTDKTEQTPTFSYIDLECETFAGWVGVTDEFMEDTFVEMATLFRDQASQNLLDTVETQLLNSSSPFTGVLQETTTETEGMTGSTFSDVTWEYLNLLQQELTTKRKRQGGCFIMHPQIWDTLTQEQDAMGRYYFDPTRGVQLTSWGYPVLLSDNMPDSGDSASSTKFVIFGNPKYMYYGIRLGMEIKYFDETMYAVQDDENFFRIRTRFACKCAEPTAYAVLQTGA